jgi:outer membrane biosynthesis protein TonB
MSWLFRNNWPWSLLAFLLGAIITWFLLARRQQPQAAPVAARQAAAETDVLVGAGARTARTTEAAPPRTSEAPPRRSPEPAPAPLPDEPVEPFDQTQHAEPEAPPEPEPAPVVQAEPEPAPVVPAALFSQRMDAGESAEPTLFDEPHDDVPPGRYGEGSAEAVPHQGPPDGFTIKGNAQSMLFHTPESPYYGRTKPEVWFRTEADAERAGFTKYVRRPRKSPRQS